MSGHTPRTASKRGQGESWYDTNAPPVDGQSRALEIVPLEAEQLRILAAVKQPFGSGTPPLKHGGVGLCVGAAVGSAVGDAVGFALGAALGEVVGMLEGDAVGDTDGLAVGAEVGTAVGMAVGLMVGTADGDAVGDAVGESVGANVQELQNTRHVAATAEELHSTSGPRIPSHPGGSG